MSNSGTARNTDMTPCYVSVKFTIRLSAGCRVVTGGGLFKKLRCCRAYVRPVTLWSQEGERTGVICRREMHVIKEGMPGLRPTLSLCFISDNKGWSFHRTISECVLKGGVSGQSADRKPTVGSLVAQHTQDKNDTRQPPILRHKNIHLPTNKNSGCFPRMLDGEMLMSQMRYFSIINYRKTYSAIKF